jgi:hypothetical protein
MIFMSQETRGPAPALASGKDRAEYFTNEAEFNGPAPTRQLPFPVIADALAVAMRLVAVNALAAEGAARRSELPAFLDRARRASAAFDEAREIYMIGSGLK